MTKKTLELILKNAYFYNALTESNFNCDKKSDYTEY